MTAVLDAATASADDATPATMPAAWRARAGALAVDTLPGLAVVATTVPLALTAPASGWLRWVFTAVAAVTLFLMAVNRLVLPSAVGTTLGRGLFGIGVRRRDGAAPGTVRLTLRELAHLLDTLALGIGWLWPLWDRRRRTLADLIARTEVVNVEPPQRDMRRLVGAVLIAATVTAVAAVGLGFGLVYRHERAVDETRQQIVEQGPGIVERMLSYGADTMAEDFARAQALTTDGYRPQLVAQQQAVEGGAPTANEYWAVNSAVLENPPVTPDRVSMLLAMQGQRGTNPDDLRLITATVKVDFDKSADGQWRVANLSVLKKPAMGGAQ